MKINIIVADEDELYLKQLTNFFVKVSANFEVHSFSKLESLRQFLLADEVAVGVLLIAENLRCAETDNCNATVKILLVEDLKTKAVDYESVPKYQKTADLLNQVTLLYGKKSGHADELARGDHNTKFIGVYSPVGGSGKTTLALLLAYKIALRKQKAFYLNYERVDSSRELLTAGAHISVSDLWLAVLSKEPDIGLNLLSKMYTEPQLGFAHVNPAESALEFNEIPVAEQLKLLDELESISQFDAVILDFESELNDDKLALLQYCDCLLTPFLPDLLSLNKLKQFIRELNLHEEYRNLLAKIYFVGNKMPTGVEGYLQQNALPAECLAGVLLPLSEHLANPLAAMRIGAFAPNFLDDVLTGLGF